MSIIPPKVSVYIASHNYGAFLKEAIESVLRQSFDSWELILINSASTDDTEEIMEIYKGTPGVRYFKQEQTDLRLAANLAIKESEGEYLIRLDADDVFDENILLVLANFLDKNPKVGIVFPDYYLTDQAGDIVKHERWEKINRSNYVQDTPPNGACTMFRNKIMKEIGGYREDLEAQDGFDVWTRIIKNHKCANINLPLFYYRRHHFNMTNDSQRILTARRTIQKDATVEKIKECGPITIVIPCRENYDFVPNLWNQEVNGQTLLAKTVKECLKSNLVSNIIVASDTDEAIKTIDTFNDPRLKFFKRQSGDTINSISFGKTLELISDYFQLDDLGICVMSYINTPFKTVSTLEESIYNLVLHGVESCIAVEKIETQVYGRTSFGLTPLNKKGDVSSDFSNIYRDSCTYVATKNIHIKNGRIFGSTVSNFLIPKNESFIVDSSINLEVAKIMDSKDK